MPPDGSSFFQIDLLGGFRLWRGDTLLHDGLPSKMAEALLAYLYTTRRSNSVSLTVSRANICAALWPDADDETARKRLKQLSQVTRSALGDCAETLLPKAAERHLLRIGNSVQTDVARYEFAIRLAERTADHKTSATQWHHAVDLYTGPFLPTCREPWAESQREYLRLRQCTALRYLLHWHEQHGNGSEALSLAQTILALDPLDEAAAADLMRLQVAVGRRAAAIQTFRQIDVRLRDNLGDLPSSALREMAARLRTGVPLDAPEPHRLTTISITPSANSDVVSPSSADTDVTLDAQRLLFALRQQGIVAEVRSDTLAGEIPLPRASLLSALNRAALALTPEERRRLGRQHADAWTKHLQNAASIYSGPQATPALLRLDRSTTDLDAAQSFLEEHCPSEALAFAASRHWHWYTRGRYREGRSHLERLLALAENADEHSRAQALLASGHFANCMGDNITAISRYHAARTLFSKLGDEDGIAQTWMREGNALQESGNCYEAILLCRRAVAHCRQSDESNLVPALFYLSEAALAANQLSERDRCANDYLSIARSAHSSRYLSLGLYSKANVLIVNGDDALALPILCEALDASDNSPDFLTTLYLTQSVACVCAAHRQKKASLLTFQIAAAMRRNHYFATTWHEQRNPSQFFNPAALELKRSGSTDANHVQAELTAQSLTAVVTFLRERLSEIAK